MKIAYFAPIYFDDLKQRPQHIAEELSKKHEVYYIEPTISAMRYWIKGGKSYKKESYSRNSNLYIIRVNGLFMLHRSLEAFDFLHLNPISERIQLHSIIQTCDVIWIGYPGWWYVVNHIKGKKIIYDKMDDHVELSYTRRLKKFIKKAEKKVIKNATEVIVTSEVFYEEIKKRKTEVYLVRNAVPIELFKLKYKKLELFLEEKTEIVYGYVGTIGNWFDFEAIRQLLNQDSRNKVIIVGSCYVPKMKHERLIYIPAIPKEAIPSMIESFDVCLYPFKKNEFLDTINPVKIYEYLAMNKPVLSVASRETMQFENVCQLYHNYNELKDKCKNIKVPFSTEKELQLFLSQNSWKNREEVIEKIIENGMDKIK